MRWSKLLSGGGTRVLRVLAVFREYMLRALEIYTGSMLLTLWALQPFRMFVLREMPVLEALYYSSYSEYSQDLGLQSSSCSYSRHAQYLGHHILEYCNTLSTSGTQNIGPRNTASTTGRIRKKVSNTMYTSILYHAAALRTDTSTYSSIKSTIWSTAVVLPPGI